MNSTKNDPFSDVDLTTILVVEDIEISLEFYINKLDAELIREYGGSSAVLKFLGNWLLLVTSGGPTEDKPEVYFIPPENINSVSHSFTIRVDNCNNTYKILTEQGVPFLTPPVNHGAETRCFFRDPDGHLFEISEYRENN